VVCVCVLIRPGTCNVSKFLCCIYTLLFIYELSLYVAVEGHEIRVVKPGTAQKTQLKTVFVYVQSKLELRSLSCTAITKHYENPMQSKSATIAYSKSFLRTFYIKSNVAV
jgi:hypothetical protein